MKKLIFGAAILVSAFFAASCQQEMLDPQAEGTTVTYTVEVPDAIATKATSDGFTLHYEVYRQGDVTNLDADPVYEGTKAFENGSADVQLEFVKDQEFTVLFWAQKGAPQAYDITDLREVSLKTLVANDTTAEVFAGNDHVNDCKSDKDGNVVLVRPVAQLNIATTADSFTLGTEGSNTATVTPTQSKVVVNGLYGTYNVADGTVDAKAERTYTEYAVPGTGFKEGTYKLMATNYLGFIPQAGDNVEVKFTIYTDGDGDIEHTVSNVPVKANYQTNILGNLISATADYQVTLEDWADSGKDMEVLADGIVENINGDYEISTAVGFAYAINKLFADGGTFYIHPGTYDFTGLVVVPQPTTPGAILNVKANEKPVVTRSTPGFEIIGLDVAYLVSEVTNGSQAIFSNLVLPEDTKLVGTNNGVVGVSGCSNEDTNVPAELIGMNGENGKVVNTVSMASVDEIKAAMEQGLKLIELTGDITGLTEIFTISKSVTIDGCGHKLTSRAGRAINVEGVDGVTIKNLVIECSGERAINVINNATNVTIDNVTATAANYTVNVALSAPGAVVKIENCTLNGLNTVNVASPSARVTINNSTINCNDNNTTAGEAYSALCLNKAAVGAEIIATNTVVNVTDGSDSSKGRNGAEDGTVTINGSTEGVTITVVAITYPGTDNYYGFETVASAIEFAKETDVISLIRNISVEETIVVEEGKTVVLDLNGKTLAAADMNVIKNNGGNLTIKNGTVTRTGDVVGYSVNNASGEIVIDNATIQRGLYTSGSKMTATNANISHEQSSRHAIYAWNCEVTIHSGTFHNDNAGNATLMASGSSVVTINGGTFSIADGRSSLGWTSSMIDQNSTAQVLVKGGLFNGGFRINSADTKLTIEGGEFNTNNGSGFTDYNGTKVVKGGKFTDEGAQNWAKKYIAEGFKMNADGEVVEKDYVAQAGDKKCESLQEAFNVGGNITLLCDVTISETATLADGKTAVLDLNGKTLTAEYASALASTEASNLTVKNGNVVAYESTVRAIGGKVIVESGEYTSTGTALDTPSTYRYSLDCREGGDLIINGGTFKSNNGMINVGSTVTINGGKFENIVEKSMTRHFAYVSAPLTINDGEFYGKANPSAGGCFFCGAAADGDIQIKGGKFTSLWTSGSVNRIFEVYFGGTINVTGGMFNTNGGIATFVTENTDDATKAAYPYVAK